MTPAEENLHKIAGAFSPSTVYKCTKCGEEFEDFDIGKKHTCPVPLTASHPIKLTVYENVTVRDQFAMAALTGLISALQMKSNKDDLIVEAAYDFADLMLAERAKK